MSFTQKNELFNVNPEEEIKIDSFLVGGCVRDLMLNPLAEAKDIDIMVEGDGIYFAERLAKKIKFQKLFLSKNLQQLKYQMEILRLR